jgi:hypothetical protein
MPTAMPASRRPPRLARTSPDRRSLAALAAAAAALAAGEVLLAVYAGGFWQWGRAEALLFLGFRPWLLLAAALIAAGSGWRVRLAFYALFLAMAGINESLYLLRLGAADPWPEMMRGWAASAALLIAIDLLVQLGRRRGKAGVAAAAVAGAALLLVPAVLKPYHALIVGRADEPPAVERPELLLMTALPIVWGDRGAFDPASRPAGAYRALQEEFSIVAIDTLDQASLGRARLLLLAQPRWLAPAELAVLDGWVRQGGRALVLTDPELVWPSDLPLGDVRRPPPVGLLGPLLDHWGLELERGGSREMRRAFEGGRMIAVAGPGRLRARGPACTSRGLIARCRLGAGRATVLADADLMHDSLWQAAGPEGGERHRRIADNPLIVADLLDELADVRRERREGEVAWSAPHGSRLRAMLLALLPLLGLAAAALLLGGGRRR